MRYLVYEYPKEQVKGRDGIVKRIPDETKDKGYNIVAGKLSLNFLRYWIQEILHQLWWQWM